MLRFLLRLFGRGTPTATPQTTAQESPPVAAPRPPTRKPAAPQPEATEGAPITGGGGSVVVRLWRAGPFVVLGTSREAAAEALSTLSHHADAAVREEAERALARWPEGDTADRRDSAPPVPSGGPTHSRGSRRSAAELMQ